MVQKFWNVRFPCWPGLVDSDHLLVIGGMGHFEIDYIMTGGGPADLTEYSGGDGLSTGVHALPLDLASAISAVILMMTGVIPLIYIRDRFINDA